MTMNFWKPAAAAVCCVIISACGSESGAPANSTIDIQIPEKDWIGGTTTFNDQPILITIRGPNGQPINDVDMTVSLDLSAGTTTPGLPAAGNEVMWLFEDQDRDGNGDTEDPSNSFATRNIGALAMPYLTSTNSFGSKQFVLRMTLDGGFYQGLLNVVSGSTFSFATLCHDDDALTPPNCT
jgi:hypothetical protein